MLVVALLLSSKTRSESAPTVWERARHPTAARGWAAHVQARRLLSESQRASDRGLARLALERSRALLEAARETTPDDPRLALDLGEVYAALGLSEQAQPLLEDVLQVASSPLVSADGWLALAEVYGHRGDVAREREAYRRFLALSPDGDRRATALVNLAEAEMALGNVEEAKRRFLEAVDVASSLSLGQASLEVVTLARWGRAVALDRAGEPDKAENEMAMLVPSGPRESLIGTQEYVYFTPNCDRHWYLALAAEARSKAKGDALWSHEQRDRARLHWAAYLDEVRAGTCPERWKTIAIGHARKVQGEQGPRVTNQANQKRGKGLAVQGLMP